MLYLKSETKPHRANLKDDYQKFQVLAESKKRAKALSDYIERARKQVYIQVSDQYKNCPSVQRFLKN